MTIPSKSHPKPSHNVHLRNIHANTRKRRARSEPLSESASCLCSMCLWQQARAPLAPCRQQRCYKKTREFGKRKQPEPKLKASVRARLPGPQEGDASRACCFCKGFPPQHSHGPVLQIPPQLGDLRWAETRISLPVT